MSEILKKIKEDLKKAMKVEVDIRTQSKGREMDMSEAIRIELAIMQKNVSRTVISMFPEIGVKPENATDENTMTILRTFAFTEKTRELYINKHITESDVSGLKPKELNNLYKEKIKELGEKLLTPKIILIEDYLPKSAAPATEDEIKEWIEQNIDFDSLKNKMQAMGLIMKHFGERADGSEVKNILLTNF